MALLLFLLQAFTGILLRFVYEPFPGRAYDSIVYFQDNILFGQLVRNIHHWSGTFLVIIVFLHMLRVFLTGAYTKQRSFNWVLGLFLLIFVVFSNFTGYLLPWDQLSYWAITVSTNMLHYIPLIGTDIMEMVRGGKEVGASTLLIFYNLHTGIFPLILITIMAFHFWRVRKAGGVILPKQKDDENSEFVTTIPNLVLREFVVALVLIAFILILSILFNAPLLDKANPDFSPNPAKAPWYFLGIQELILHFHPLFASIIIPLTVFILLLLLPYFKNDSESSGEWFLSAKGKSMAIFSAGTSLIITPSIIIIDEYLLDLSIWTPGIPNFISNGLLPFAILIAILSAYFQLIKKKYNATKSESIQALFILITVSFIILTITGIFFRGMGMALGLL